MMRLFPSFFFPVIIAGNALFETVYALLHRQWLSAGVSACILPVATNAARNLSESGNPFRDHPRRAPAVRGERRLRHAVGRKARAGRSNIG
jgi:hypothetical protein